MLMEKIVISLYLLLLLVRPGYQNVFTPSLEANIRSFINASMECRHVPGMTLTVVKGKGHFSLSSVKVRIKINIFRK